MPETSAGILLFRRAPALQVLLVHPGGPFWKSKDAGAWTIPKGKVEPGEEPLAAALREFTEETGVTPPPSVPIALTPVRLKSGKAVHAWAVEGDCDAAAIVSNTVRMEWPPRTGRFIDIPEVDRAAWLTTTEAADKINPAQLPLIQQLEQLLNNHNPPTASRD
ncbi:MAG TPA: NUDIX domain-containing protein [Phycisphaerales bacterium]|nr:NUDIX domain-containing protein [Phycisphaerales bacterium]